MGVGKKRGVGETGDGGEKSERMQPMSCNFIRADGIYDYYELLPRRHSLFGLVIVWKIKSENATSTVNALEVTGALVGGWEGGRICLSRDVVARWKRLQEAWKVTKDNIDPKR